MDALDLLRSYVTLHNRGVETGDFAPMLALFDPRAELRFEGAARAACVGSAAIAEAFRQSPPDDALVLLEALKSTHRSADAIYGWRAARPGAGKEGGTLHVEAAGGMIRRLRISVK